MTASRRVLINRPLAVVRSGQLRRPLAAAPQHARTRGLRLEGAVSVRRRGEGAVRAPPGSARQGVTCEMNVPQLANVVRGPAGMYSAPIQTRPEASATAAL